MADPKIIVKKFDPATKEIVFVDKGLGKLYSGNVTVTGEIAWVPSRAPKTKKAPAAK